MAPAPKTTTVRSEYSICRIFTSAYPMLASHSASRQHGYRWAADSRDEIVPPLQGVAGRLERALRNFAETFPLFAAAVLVAGIANRHSWMTVHGSELYFIARVAYVPLYAFGVRLVRSFVWNAATMGIALMRLYELAPSAKAFRIRTVTS